MTPGSRRILLVEINEDGTVGGSHRCLFDLACRMDRERYAPVVLFYEHNVYVDRLRAEGIEVHAWDAERRVERNHRRRGPIARRLLAWWGAGAAILRRARFLRREGIDLIHLNNSPCIGFSDWLPAARLVRVPCIAHARGGYVSPGTGVGRWLTRRYDRVIPISRHIAANMLAAGIPRDRMRQIYDGIVLDDWRPEDRADPERVRRSLGIPADALLVILVGHLRWWKGQDVLLAALRGLDPGVRGRIRTLLVGGAPESDAAYQQRLRSEAREGGLDDCVTFLGQRDDVADLMYASDVLVHASTVPEPLGLVVLEGMALGKTVIASRLGGPAEIVTGSSGMLFDPATPAELATLLAGLVDDPSRCQAFAEAARRRVRDFDIRTCVERTQEVYAAHL